MGFFEDDRIRRKNAVFNEAYKIYRSYRDKMWSDNDIISAMTKELEKDTLNKVNYEVIKIAIRNTNSDIDINSNQS